MRMMTSREHLRQRLTDIEGGRRAEADRWKQQAQFDAQEINRLEAALLEVVDLLQDSRLEDAIQVALNAHAEGMR